MTLHKKLCAELGDKDKPTMKEYLEVSRALQTLGFAARLEELGLTEEAAKERRKVEERA